MFETAFFEFKRGLKGKLGLTGVLSLYILMMIAFFPSIKGSAVDLDEYMESFPPELMNAFARGGLSLSTLEGFLTAEVYQWIFVLILGIYFAYSTSSLITKEKEKGSLDLLLANPVSRVSIIVEKFLSVIPSLFIINLVLPFVAYYGANLIGESLKLEPLFRLHLLAIPYLMACASIGLFLSTIFDDVSKAKNISIGVIFLMYILDSLTIGTDLSWIGKFTLSRYFVPGEILIGNEVDWIGMGILLTFTAALVVLSSIIFKFKDI